ARSRHARGAPERSLDRADPHGVLAARAVSTQPTPGPDAVDHLRAGLGLRLRVRLELPRRLHRLPAAQDGSGRRAATHPDRPRRRIRAARAVSFRARLALVAAAAVALAVIAASLVVFFVARNQLQGQVDSALQARYRAVVNGPGPGLHLENGYLEIPFAPFGAQTEYVQAVPETGPPVITRFERGPLPVSSEARRAAKGEGGQFCRDARAPGTDFRVLTVPGSPYALQIARPLTEVNNTLHRITLFLILIAAGGIAVAAGLG